MALFAASALAAADHPTVLLVNRAGMERPIIGVEGTEPVVEVDGKKTRIRDNPPIAAERAPYYGEGFVELSEFGGTAFGKGYLANQDAVNPDRVRFSPGGTRFAVDLRPSIEVRGGFLAIITFVPEFYDGTLEKSSAQIVVQSLPTLPAGVKTHFETGSPGTWGQQYVLLVFAAGGAEIKSNIAEGIATYFSRIEHLRLAAAIEKYRKDYRGKDHAAMPFVRFRPTLPTGLSPPDQTVTATLDVGDNGVVDNVAVSGATDPKVEASIRETLQGWLFLPRLKAGVPAATRIAVPLVFSASEKR
jgi:hypothetical protein